MSHQLKLEEKIKSDKERQYKALNDLWISNFAPQSMHNSQKTFLSADVLISAMEPIIPRPSNSGKVRKMLLLLTEVSKDVIIRVFYNFNNEVSFEKFVGLELCAFGETKEVVSIEGVRDVTFSHIFTRNTGETVGLKVRATIVAFKVKTAKTQLPYNISHDRYLDTYMDPYADAISSVEVLGVEKGQVGDYYEKNNLSNRTFPSVIDTDLKAKFDEIEGHLNKRTSECVPLLKTKLGMA